MSLPESIICPQCGTRSHNSNDVEQRFCVRCGFHADFPTARVQWRVWWINDRGEKHQHVCGTERDARGLLERVRRSERGVIGWERETVEVLPLPPRDEAGA